MIRRIRGIAIRGIAIRVHWSWLAVAALISWSLATGFFAEEFQWSVPKRWAWATGCAGAFFVSVLLHELSHAFVAQRYAMKVPSITLFIFGGVSNIESEMKTPGQEFRVAIAGPLLSLVLGITLVAAGSATNNEFGKVFLYLGFADVTLGLFNLLPGSLSMVAVCSARRRGRAPVTSSARRGSRPPSAPGSRGS